MDQSLENSTADLRKYLQTLRARKWSIILTIVLVVGAAVGFSYLQTPLYEAEARILIRPLTPPGAAVAQPVDVQTESQVVDSEPVAALVRDQLGLRETPQSLSADLTVSGANTSTSTSSFSSPQVLLLRFTSPDPNLARRATNAFLQQYIEYRRQQVLDAFLAAQEAVQKRIEAASRQLDQVTTQLKKAAKSDRSLANTLEIQRSVVVSRLGVLQQRLDDLQPDQSVRSGGAEVIQSAKTPSSPVSPNFVKNAGFAAVIGLLLGIGIAFLRERLDDRFRGPADIEETLQAPVLATVPRFPPSKEGAGQLVTASETKSVASEAYRSLRTNLQFAISQRGVKSLIVTSPSAGEGKTVTAANLAVFLAQAGLRVVVVSADLRRPTLERYFNVDKRHGLATFLNSMDATPWDVIRDPGISNLRLIPCGPIPDNPAELLVSSRLGQMLDFLEDNCDLVVIDTPPLLAVADAAILGPQVGGAVLVLDATNTHRSASLHAKEQLERGGGELIGTVLNAFDPQSAPYYYAPYYYSAGYESNLAGQSNGEPSTSTKPSLWKTRSLFGNR